ncbi:hypothetical protein [Flavobacterium caseinilyticum]|uniref:Uncharacterized protein n=1 Tax=Flavobacterium caseinilyticum TaxID=2541732 RepID=A0A4R5ARW0_9FLAO|nr:hypothetical protein [Flavobacterium caseinilyticum]TDD74995.1 hypothetical protein E0F89_13900 [Flavobacterium caseinilyticum]
MDFIFLPVQNFTFVSFIAFGIVVMSFLVEAMSNSPYKSLLLSNIGFGLYYFTLLNGSEIDFPIYFMLLSFLICSWFFVLKNIEEEEDEDRGYLRNFHNDSANVYDEIEDGNSKENTSLSAFSFLHFTNVLCKQLSKLSENKFMLYLIHFLKNDAIYYKHPQRKLVQAFTYIILIATLVSFFYV